MSSIAGPKIISDGLVLYLDAANRSSYATGSTTWYDLSGNGNHGALTNGPTYDSVNNMGTISFDGSNDHINVTQGLSGRQKWSSYWANSNKLSIVTFLKPNIVYYSNGPRAGIIGNRYFYDTGYFNLHLHDGWRLAYNSGYNGNLALMLDMQPYIGSKLFLALTHNGDLSSGCIRYCVNGTFYNASLGSTVSVGTFMSGTGYDVRIGTEQSPLQMDMYNISMYNRLLSDSEVLQIYSSLRPRYGI